MKKKTVLGSLADSDDGHSKSARVRHLGVRDEGRAQDRTEPRLKSASTGSIMSKPFIPAWIDDAGLSAAEFRIYCHLARRADNANGLAWPSYEAMEESCGLSRRTVARALASLVKRKLIEKAGKPFGGSARYRLLEPMMPPEAPLDTPNGANADTNGNPPIASPELINSATRDTPIVPPETREGSPLKVPQRRKPIGEISPEGIVFADWFKSTLPVGIHLKSNWQALFGKAFDELVKLDKRSPEEIRRVSQWARTDGFWSTNFMSPAKLRKRNGDGIQYFDVFLGRMSTLGGAPGGGAQRPLNMGRRAATVSDPIKNQ